MTKLHPSRLVVAGLAVSLLAACSSGGGTGSGTGAKTPGATKSSAPSGATADPSDGGATADPSTNGALALGTDAPDLSKTIITRQFTLPGSSEHKVTVGILSLERRDKVAILKVALTPDFADLPGGKPIDFIEAIDGSAGIVWQPTLLDLTNLKRYNVLHQPGTDGSGKLLFEDGKAASGQPIYGWAVFAAPPAGVVSLDVTIADWMPRFTNVPIQ